MMQSADQLQKLIHDYWFNKLATAPVTAKKGSKRNMVSLDIKIEARSLTDLYNVSNRVNIGEFVFFISTFGILLQKYFTLDCCVINSPDIDPNPSNTRKDHVLFYVNGPHSGKTYKEIISSVTEEVKRVFNHKDYEYDTLKTGFLEKGINERDLLNFGLSYSKVNGTSDYLKDSGLHLHIDKDLDENLHIKVSYDVAVYDPFLINQFANHYSILLKNIKSNLDVVFDDLILMSDEEEMVIKNKFNNYNADDFNYTNIIDSFTKHVKNNPNAIAIRVGETAYTYQQLDEKSSQLAAYLVNDQLVKHNQLIGIITGKTEWTIISILGILKSGGAFVPIEPSQPVERIQYIVNDAEINVLLLESELMFDYNWFTGNMVVTDIQTDTFNFNDFVPHKKLHPKDLAYVIYTSGTTGSPKGVLVSCGSVVNYAEWLIESYSITSKDSSVILASLAYDLGYTSIWGTLLAGATLHMIAFDYGSEPDLVLRYIADHKITFIKATPSLFYILCHVPLFKNIQNELTLKLILLGGEFIRKDDVELFLNYCPQTKFVNHYGPTECTIGCIANNITGDNTTDLRSDLPVIGKPIKNCEVFILGDNNALTPIGLEGEICVGGETLALGYLNNAELTSLKFIPHPFHNSKKLYRTGDYGQWTGDGSIILHGRKDNQIKIRGHRVELGEIEYRLLQYEFITDAIVVANTTINGDKRIIGYYKALQLIDEKLLRAYMTTYLSVHMIPECFIEVAHIPLTANGKTDFKKLPSPDTLLENVKSGLINPRNEAEDIIMKAWQEVLLKKNISINDNFFDIGGNSLYLIRVSLILSQSFPEVTIVDLFNYTTIEKLAQFITEKNEGIPIVIAESEVSFPEKYFADFESNEGTADLRFQIKGYLLQELKNVAYSEGIGITDLLKAMFAYTIYELSGQENVNIQCLSGKMNEVYLQDISLNFTYLQDPSALFAAFTGKSADNSKIAYEQVKNVHYTKQLPGAVIPMVYIKDLLNAKELPSGLFDLIMEIDDSDSNSLNCVFEYTLQLNPSLMKDFVTDYVNNLSLLLRVEK